MGEPTWDLRLGDWRDVLADVTECGALITDPPYSERTDAGYRSGSGSGGMTYRPWTATRARVLVEHWATRADWLVAFNDHTLMPALEEAAAGAGLYSFAPVPWVKTDGPPRLMADGPSPSSEWIFVARRRRQTVRRHRPGHYIGKIDKAPVNGPGKFLVGSKPLWLMRALIRSYSEPGDLVVDPFAGSGTTLLAALMEGRSCIGAEIDPKIYRYAKGRLERGYQPALL